MDFVKFIGGPGLFLLLAILVIAVVVFNKLKGRK